MKNKKILLTAIFLLVVFFLVAQTPKDSLTNCETKVYTSYTGDKFTRYYQNGKLVAEYMYGELFIYKSNFVKPKKPVMAHN